MISICQTGYNIIDIEAANENAVIVSNVPGYATYSVAELVFALALDLMRKVRIADSKLREGSFDLRDNIGNQLMERQLG